MDALSRVAAFLWWLAATSIAAAAHALKSPGPVAIVILAVLPGAVITADALFISRRRFNAGKKSIAQTFAVVSDKYPAFKESLDDYAPVRSLALLAALLLTLLFLLVARATNVCDPRVLCQAGSCSACPGGPLPAEASPATPAKEAAADDQEGLTEKVHDAPTAERRTDVAEARAGFLYAGYGAYVSTLSLAIMRINSAALTGRFVLNSALRVALALILGFVAGGLNIVSAAATPNQALAVYFAVGIFPAWVMGFVRDRARAWFAVQEDGCESLPLCLVDGLDDGIIDRLAEIGIWDIQHLAASKPVELAIRTLYPMPRVLDWIDQAHLIQYARHKIPMFRAAGLRGAIDLAAVYRDSMLGTRLVAGPNAAQGGLSALQRVRKHDADTLLGLVASKTDTPVETLKMIGRTLSEDNLLKFVRELWFFRQNTGVDRAILDAAVEAALPDSFETEPEMNGRIVPPLTDFDRFEQRFHQVLAARLAPWGLRWTGEPPAILDVTTWAELVERVESALVWSRKSAGQ